MQFSFDNSEKNINLYANASEKYFYQVTSSCSLIFLHTDGKILLDIEDKTIKNFLGNLVSKKNPISEPVIGNSFALDITGEKIGIDKLVFFYIEGRIDNKELALLVRQLYQRITENYLFSNPKNVPLLCPLVLKNGILSSD